MDRRWSRTIWRRRSPHIPSAAAPNGARRSEEHTSELQSPDHLVCRLLLEKKKHNTRHLISLGHDVMGVDLTPQILDRARLARPEEVFHQADLGGLPAEGTHVALILIDLA